MRKNIPLLIIFFVVFVDLLGFGILIPILPTFTHLELHLSEIYVGISMAAYSLVQFLFNPLLGSMSDKYGRRNIILGTLLLNAVGYVLFSYTHSFWMLLLSRVIAGLGGSSIGVAQAYIADVTKPEERSKGMALIGVAFGVGFVFGPFIGGVLSKYGYFVTGLTSAAFSLLAFILSVFLLPESLSPKRRLEMSNKKVNRSIINVAAFKQIYREKDKAMSITLFFFLTFASSIIYGTFALLGAVQYHLTNRENGYLFATIGIVSATIQGGLIGRLSKKYKDKTLVIAGNIFMIFGLLFLPYSVNLVGLVITIVVLSIGTGTLQPIFLGLISKVSKDHEQGLILSVNQSMSAFARMIGPLWGTFAYQFLGYSFPFVSGAIFTALILLFTIVYFDKFINPKISEVGGG